MITLIKNLVLTAILLVVLSCSAKREMVTTFGSYDSNRDDRVDREEFETVFAEQGDFNTWDIDEDRRLTEDEWENGFNVYSSSYPYEERGVFDDWDTDNDSYVDDDEYNDGFFGLWDSNDDDYVEEREFDENSR
jgi:hypothetical protein